MADPLSIGAGVVGIIVPALHGSRLLLDDLQAIIDAPKVLETLKNNVSLVEMALASLQAVKDADWELLGDAVAEQSKAAIQACTKACDLFYSDLQRWTKHSNEGTLSFYDRANVGFLKQRRIKAISSQLQTCHISINSVVSIATLYSSIRTSTITEDIKKSISMKEEEISNAISSTDKKLMEAENSLGGLNIGSPSEEQGQDAEDILNMVKQVEEERSGLNLSRKLLEELLLRAKEEAVFKAASEMQSGSTHITFGNLEEGFQIGTNNAAISGIHF